MKKIFFSICALSLATAVQAQTLDRSIRPKAGPAPEIHLGEAETFTLDNGLKVFVVENHKMPIVTYSMVLDVRPALEGNKAGMQSLVGELITAGTHKRSKDQFDKEVDGIGAQIGAGSASMYGQALTKHQDKLLDLMSDALMNANFQQSELDKLVKQTKSGLQTAENDPDAMLQNVSGVLNFGKNHPYGEVVTPATVDNVTLADCKNYYQTYFRPNVAYLAVVGDITKEQAQELVGKYFGSWKKAEVPRTEYPKVSAPEKTTVDFVPREGAVQSVIGITYPVTLEPGDPDVLKVKAMNEILGGSSQGRLFLNLRETHAWTYGSYSSISSDDIIGHATVYAKCRNAVTDSSIHEMIKEMKTIREEVVPEESLQNMLNYMSGKFALALENPQTIAQFAINIDRYDMPKDYYKNYLKNVNAITPADVQEVAQKYVLPEHAHIVVVGNQSEAEKLKRFSADGTINYYDNYGNPKEAPKVTKVDGVTVEDVLANYVKAIGGKEAIEQLKDVTFYASLDMGAATGKLTQIAATPDKLKQTVQFNGTVVQEIVLNGDKGYQSSMGNKAEMDADAVQQYKQQADLQSDLHPEKYGITYSLNGIEDLDGKKVYNVAKVSNNGADRSVQYYDVASGLLVKEIANTTIQGQQALIITNYSDYKEVKGGNGYKIPFVMNRTMNGMAQKFEIQSAKANTGVKESTFK